MDVKNSNEFEKARLRALQDSNITKMMSESSPLRFENDTIIFENDGEIETCPNYPVSFDIDQGGNVRKADDVLHQYC